MRKIDHAYTQLFSVSFYCIHLVVLKKKYIYLKTSKEEKNKKIIIL